MCLPASLTISSLVRVFLFKFHEIRPEFFYFSVYERAPCIIPKTEIKIKRKIRNFIFILSSRPITVKKKKKKNRNFVYKTLCSQRMLKYKDGLNKQSSIDHTIFFKLNKYRSTQSVDQVSSLFLKCFSRYHINIKKLSNLFVFFPAHVCQPIFKCLMHPRF